MSKELEKTFDPTTNSESNLVVEKKPESKIIHVSDFKMMDGSVALMDEARRINITQLAKEQGVPSHKRPQWWLKLESTKEAITYYTDECDREPVSVIRGGPDQGTYVIRELVLDFGMWVSMALKSYVIDTFFGVVQPPASGESAIMLHSDRATLGKEVEEVNNNLLDDLNACQVYVNDRRSSEVSMNLSEFVFFMRRHYRINTTRDMVIMILQDSGIVGKSIMFKDGNNDNVLELYPKEYVFGQRNKYVKECDVYNDVGDYIGSTIKLTILGQGFVMGQVRKINNIR